MDSPFFHPDHVIGGPLYIFWTPHLWRRFGAGRFRGLTNPFFPAGSPPGGALPAARAHRGGAVAHAPGPDALLRGTGGADGLPEAGGMGRMSRPPIFFVSPSRFFF